MDEVSVAYSLSEIIENGGLLQNHRSYLHCRKEAGKTYSTSQSFEFNIVIYLLFQNSAVYLGCYNKLPWTGWLINSRNLLLTIMETGKSGSQDTGKFGV